MNCEKAIELISAEADAALSEQERAELEKHLSECTVCRRYRDALRMIDEGVSEPVNPPETLLLDVMSELRLRETEQKTGGRRRRASVSRWGSLAACAVLVAGAALLGLRPGGFLRPKTSVMTAAANEAAPRMMMVEPEAFEEECFAANMVPAEAAGGTGMQADEPMTFSMQMDDSEEESFDCCLSPESDGWDFAVEQAQGYLESELGLTAESVSDWDEPSVECAGDECRVTFTTSDGEDVTVVMNGSGDLLEIEN